MSLRPAAGAPRLKRTARSHRARSGRRAGPVAERHAGEREGAQPAASAEPPSRRREELARLLPLWPHELADETPAGRAHLIGRLERALRAERRRGLAGHWAYDLARHAALLKAYRAEVAAAAGRPKVPRPPDKKKRE